MKKRRLLTVCGLALAGVFAMTAFLVGEESVDAQKCRIVRIHQEKGTAGTTIRIEPQTIHISKDTCVIWINWVPTQEVSVLFREDGKRCQDATDSPVGFSMSENCYVTDFISHGGTTSLRFNEAGIFEYEIQVPGGRKSVGPGVLGHGEMKAKGKIVVE